MRTLKKTLCMVLVLAMMVGLCAIGASAVSIEDYSDKDAIEHKEAVAVLSAINVLQGDDKGTFRPKDPLTRAESAAFFARLCATNGAGTSTFTDMGSYAWAQPYVAYCQKVGIINGRGDGTFGPGESVTNVAWAKMCLGALGYDAEIEGLVGAAWEVNTIKLVNTLGLSKGIADFDWNAPITRDDAAQFAFNTLTQTMVQYRDGLDIKVNTGDTNVEITNNGLYHDQGNETYDYREKWYAEHEGTMQFVENYFPTLKLVTDTDKYGLLNDYWYTAKDRQSYVKTDANTKAVALAVNVLKTYTIPAAVTSHDLYKDAALKADDTLKIYDNSAFAGYVALTKGGTGRPLAGYNGATIYLVDEDDDGEGDYFLAKYALLAKVSKVTEAAKAASKERTLELTIYNGYNGTGDPADPIVPGKSVKASFESELYSKNEFVLVYPDQITMADCKNQGSFTNQIIELGSPEVAKGTLNSVSTATVSYDADVPVGSASGLTVDGVKYSVGSKYMAQMGPAANTAAYNNNYTLNTPNTLYLSNGFVLGASGTATPLADYVFILAVDSVGEYDMFTGKTSYKVGYVKQDGTTGTTKISPYAAIAGKWAEMTPLGESALFTLATTQFSDRSAEVKNDTPSLGVGASTNANTNFVVRSGSVVVTIKANTGISSIPHLKAAALGPDNVFVLNNSLGTAAAVFLDFSGSNPESTSTKNMFFLTRLHSGEIKENGIPYYQYQVINSAGELEIVKVSGAAKTKIEGGFDGRLWTPEVDANGYVTDVKAPANCMINTYQSDVKAGAGVVTVGATTYAAGSANVYIFYKNQTIEKATLDDLNGLTGYIALENAPLTSNVATIYFKEA